MGTALVAPAFAQDTAILDAIADALAPEMSFTYGTVTETADGVTVADAVIAPAAADPEDGRLTVGRMVFAGVDDEAARGLLPHIDALTLQGVVFEPKGDRGVARFATIALNDVGLPTGLFAYLLDDTGDDDEEAQEATDADDEPTGLSDEEILALISGVTLGSAEISDMDTLEPRDGGDRQVLQVATVRLDGLDEGWVEQVRLDGVRVEDLGILSIDSIVLDRLDLIALTQMAIAVRVGEIQDEESFTLDPGLDRFAILGVTVSDQTGTDLATLEALSIDEIQRTNDEVTQGRLALDHLAMPASSLDMQEIEAAFADMRYDHLDLSMEFRGIIDPEGRALAITPLSLTLDGMASLAVTLRFGNFNLDELVAQVRQMLDTGVPAIPLTTLAGLEIQVVDASLTERLIDFLADGSGRARGAVIDDAVAQLEAAIASLSIAGPIKDALLDAVRSFLTNPGTLTVSAAPAAPVPVVEAGLGLMTSPDATLERLGVQVVAEPAP